MSRRRRKSHAGTIVLSIILVLLIAAVGTGVWYLGKHKGSEVYLDNTMFMGENVSGKKPMELANQLIQSVEDVEISLTEAGQPAISGKLAAFGYTLDAEKILSSLENAMKAQKSSLGSVLKCLTGTETDINADVSLDFDENVFNGKVQVSSLPIPRVASADAQLISNSAARVVEVVQEINGNEFDEGAFRSWVKTQIDKSIAENGMEDISLAFPEELYIRPQVTAEAAGFNAKAEALNKFAGAEITYEFGSQTEVLDYDTIISWLDVNGSEATLNQEKLDEWILHLLTYNTRYRDRKFTTTGGDVITIPEYENEYGYRLNEDAEREQILADITSGAPVSREPRYYITNKWDNPVFLKREGKDDLAGTYVEVSIKKQHLWYYVDYELYLQSDVVTGDVTKDRGTMTGAYPLSYKQRDYTLTGDGWSNFVSYWMPFIEGQGLHDASWRGNFGGSIYKGHGSHGCVNLPTGKARDIYDKIQAGTCIIIY